jgi:glycosyltransferase XagB
MSLAALKELDPALAAARWQRMASETSRLHFSEKDVAIFAAVHGMHLAPDGLRLLPPEDIAKQFRLGSCSCTDATGRMRVLIGLDNTYARSIAAQELWSLRDQIVLTTREEFEHLFCEAFGQALARTITDQIKQTEPSLSAHMRITPLQASVLTAVCVAVAECFLFSGAGALALLMAAALFLFAIPMAFQIVCMFARPLPEQKPEPLCSDILPSYTVLVPLHGEASVAGRLIDALEALDYPQDRLEIIFLIEQTDHATFIALHRRGLGKWMRILRVPEGEIRTKPRALNLGLLAARGQCITVYDAEDRPHPAQLRSAAAVLCAPDSGAIGCVQAPLMIDNAAESWCAGMFALEYAALFLVLKPSAGRLGLPVPLGGTSNHFRTGQLRQFGGWDARNVTEDADLGLRLYRLGLRTTSISEPTFEEAPIDWASWLGQRRRWQKGWFQTGLVHSREPLEQIRESGFARASLLMVYAVTLAFASLLFPASILAVAFWLVSLFVLGSEAPWLIGIVWITLPLLSQIISGMALMRAGKLLGLQRMAGSLAGQPFYQLMIAYAAMLGLVDLVRALFHWRKTTHGVSKMRDASRHALVAPKAGTASSNALSQVTRAG